MSTEDIIPSSALGNPSTAAPQGTDAVSDIIPQTALGSTDETPVHAVAPKWMIEGDKPLVQPEVEFLRPMAQGISKALNWPGKALTGAAVRAGVSNPYAAAAIGSIPDIAEDVLLGRLGPKGESAPPEAGVPEGPYTAAVATEQARLGAIRSRGQALGLEIPSTGSSADFAAASNTNQPISEAVIRKNFNLPNDAPLTPQMMDSVRGNVGDQTYGPIRQLKDIQLPDDVVSQLKGLPPTVLKKLPITDDLGSDNTVSGNGLVDLSQGLRGMSNDYWEAYERSQLPEHKYLAQQLDSAVDGVEGAARTHLAGQGNEVAADNWEQGRTTIAQTYNVQRAIKNGHLDVNNLARQQNNGAPLSGDLQVLATLADHNPDAFKFTRMNKPAPGLAARAAAAFAPTIGTGLGAIGGTLAAGPGIGTAGGALLGKGLAENLAKRLTGP